MFPKESQWCSYHLLSRAVQWLEQHFPELDKHLVHERWRQKFLFPKAKKRGSKQYIQRGMKIKSIQMAIHLTQCFLLSKCIASKCQWPTIPSLIIWLNTSWTYTMVVSWPIEWVLKDSQEFSRDVIAGWMSTPQEDLKICLHPNSWNQAFDLIGGDKGRVIFAGLIKLRILRQDYLGLPKWTLKPMISIL